jgi:hypothetical protein
VQSLRPPIIRRETKSGNTGGLAVDSSVSTSLWNTTGSWVLVKIGKLFAIPHGCNKSGGTSSRSSTGVADDVRLQRTIDTVRVGKANTGRGARHHECCEHHRDGKEKHYVDVRGACPVPCCIRGRWVALIDQNDIWARRQVHPSMSSVLWGCCRISH